MYFDYNFNTQRRSLGTHRICSFKIKYDVKLLKIIAAQINIHLKATYLQTRAKETRHCS